MHISWASCGDNGAKILKYQVQVKEIKSIVLEQRELNLNAKSVSSGPGGSIAMPFTNPTTTTVNTTTTATATTTAATTASTIGKIDATAMSVAAAKLADHELTATTASDAMVSAAIDTFEDDDLPVGYFATKWTTVYSNKNCEAVIDGPAASTIRWSIRIRAQNAGGWSNPSDSLVMNYKTHPSLFPAGFTMSSLINNAGVISSRILGNAK